MSVKHRPVSACDASVKKDAVQTIQDEKALGVFESFKIYKKAVLWSVALSTCIVMEGFDMIILNSLYALSSFQDKFGTLNEHGEKWIPFRTQMLLSNASLVGQILGLVLSGYVVEKVGYRYTLLAGLTTLGATITAPFVAEKVWTLALGQFLCGVPWGVFQTTVVVFASEVAPLPLRPLLTTYVNFCWCLGQMISSFVLKQTSLLEGVKAYKIPFATQWCWILPLIIAISFAPESPWWLIRRGRTEDAKRHLLRLTSRHHNDHVNTKAAVNMMFYTNELEKSQSGGINYLDCLKGTDLRRTEITCNVWGIQTLSGGALMGYAAYFYTQAGMSNSSAFTFQIAQFGLGMLGTALSWFLMARFGKRQLYLFGQAIGLVIFLVMGILSVSTSGVAASWAIGSLLLAFTFFYDATVGPVCYTLVAEVSSTRLRNKTICLGRMYYNVLGIVFSSLNSLMLNPSAWNLGAKSGFVYTATTLAMLTWTYFRLPETKGRSFAELDLMFEDKLPARDFENAVVSIAARSNGPTYRSAADLQSGNFMVSRGVSVHGTVTVTTEKGDSRPNSKKGGIVVEDVVEVVVSDHEDNDKESV